MRRSAGTLAALSLAIALAACGGGSAPPAEQALPRALANDLAGQSDQIADALEGGDVCRAAELADTLKDAVDAAVSGGRIPPAFQDELERTATDLQNQVNCEKEKEHGDEGKGKKKDQHGETTTLGTTVSTTTGESG